MKLHKRLIRMSIIALCCIVLNFKASALIPNTISSNYTVNTNDASSGPCTIMPNCTLTVNNGAIASFTGHIKISDRAALIVNGATLQMSQNTRIILRGYYGTGSLAA